VEELHELAGGYADAIIEELYEHFFAFEETRGFFSDPATFDYVKGMQKSPPCGLPRAITSSARYDLKRAHGKTHNQALRAVANRLVGILHGCLRHRQPYDESIAWASVVEKAA
jgi:hypothetical protein